MRSKICKSYTSIRSQGNCTYKEITLIIGYVEEQPNFSHIKKSCNKNIWLSNNTHTNF